MTIETIPITSREKWLEHRKQDITASDVGALFGVDDYKSPLMLWAQKTGKLEEPEPTRLMKRGVWLETAVLTAIIDENPTWSIEQPKVYIRDPYARIGATPDAIATIPGIEGEVIIQCKVVSRPVFERDWKDRPPEAYRLQALTEAMLWNSPTAYLAALVIDTWSADLVLVEVERDPVLEAGICHEVMTFWENTEVGRPPPADYSIDLDLLSDLYPPVIDDPPLDLSEDNRMVELLDVRAGYKSQQKGIEAELEAIDAEIIEKLDGHQIAFTGSWKVSRKLQHRKEYTVAAKSFPVMRITAKKVQQEEEKTDE